MVAHLKQGKDIKRVSKETKFAMIADAPMMSREEFNAKYPDYVMTEKQFDHFVMAIRRGDDI